MQVPESDFKVLVRCFTFNHSKFIETTMDGFVMQQTDFSYVCCIVDDCSTDGEQEVILSYINNQFDTIQQRETEDATILFARHKSNKNCSFEVHFLKYNHYSSRKPKAPYLAHWKENTLYEALCEGDDYWIDTFKLQMQVDFLDNHPDYSLCFTGSKVISSEESLENTLYQNLEEREYSANEIFENWVVPTATVIYRNTVIRKKHKDFLLGDIVLFLSAAEYGRIWRLDKQTAVYRRSHSGMTFAQEKKDPIRFIRHYERIKESFPQLDRQLCDKFISLAYAGRCSYLLKKYRIIAFFILYIKSFCKYRITFIRSFHGLLVKKITS